MASPNRFSKSSDTAPAKLRRYRYSIAGLVRNTQELLFLSLQFQFQGEQPIGRWEIEGGMDTVARNCAPLLNALRVPAIIVEPIAFTRFRDHLEPVMPLEILLLVFGQVLKQQLVGTTLCLGSDSRALFHFTVMSLLLCLDLR